jgi:hypothetical protein
MKTHNDRIQSLASVALADEDIIGASINWYITPNPVSLEKLGESFAGQGIDASLLPEATTGKARFRELCLYINPRLYRRLTDGTKREFLVAQVKHDESDSKLTSYSYSANLREGTERSRLVQIGTLTFNSETDSFSWRYTHDRRNRDESLDDYIDRCLSSQSCFERTDLEFFGRFCDSILDEVAIYSTGRFVDAIKLRDTLRELFLQSGCYSLSARGGFWYAPRVGDGGGPFAFAKRLIAAYETADKNNRFLLLTMPKDAQTIETAATVVEDGLLSRVSDIEKAIETVRGQTRAGQHDSRLEELRSIAAQADLYSEILGMTTTSLQDKIESLRGIIASQTAKFVEEADQRRFEKAQAKTKTVGAVEAEELFPSLAPISGLTTTFLRTAVAQAGKTGSSDVMIGGLTLRIEPDPTLGYTYRIETETGRVLRSGSASTQKATVDALRSLVD